MAARSKNTNGRLDKKLQAEVLNLIQYIQRLRSEIAGIAVEKDEVTTFAPWNHTWWIATSPSAPATRVQQ